MATMDATKPAKPPGPSAEKTLQDAIRAMESTEKLFSSSVRSLRQRIKMRYETILLDDAVGASKSSIDKQLWKYGFYVIIEQYRKIHRRAENRNDDVSQLGKTLFREFLLEASGFYNNLLIKLEEKADAINNDNSATHESCVEQSNTKVSTNLQRVCRTLRHRSLVYLGDIARYETMLNREETQQKTVSPYTSYSRAIHFYYQAISVCADDGSPLNQLALLGVEEGGLYETFVSTYYYFRSIASKKPGSNAVQNVRGVLRKIGLTWKDQKYIPKRQHSDLQAAWYDRSQLLTSFYESFVRLHGVLYMADSLDEFETLCNSVLDLFSKCLFISWYHTLMPESVFESSGITCATALHLFSTNIFSVWHQQVQSPDASSRFEDCADYFAVQHFIQYCLYLGQLLQTENHFEMFGDYLASIKVYVDWLATPVRLHRFRLKGQTMSTKRLWNALAFLLNTLVPILDREENIDTTVDITFDEDFDLRGFMPLETSQTTIDYDNVNNREDEGNTGVQRIAQILRVAKTLATKPETHLMYDEVSNIFLVQVEGTRDPVPPNLDQAYLLPRELFAATTEAQEPEIMRRMAQVRLQMEIEQLESTLGSSTFSSPSLTIPPFLVLDTSCFIQSLSMVKQFVDAGCFILVIPLAVIDGLDVLKKGNERLNRGAREATRYLETVFKQANTSVRAQMRDESLEPPFEPPPTIASETLRVLSCAMYFAHRVSQRPDLVTILTNDSSLTEMAHMATLSVHQVQVFARGVGIGADPRANDSGGGGRRGGGGGGGRGGRGGGRGGRGRGGGGGGRRYGQRNQQHNSSNNSNNQRQQ